MLHYLIVSHSPFFCAFIKVPKGLFVKPDSPFSIVLWKRK
jgi:hypothetical protein